MAPACRARTYARVMALVTAVRRPTTTPAIVAANLALAIALLVGQWELVLLAAVVVPAGLAIAARPQRGVLALVALAPFHGLLLIAPLPPMFSGWKEALVLVTLAATFVAPPSALAATGRPLPIWVPAVLGLVALGSASALMVGGTQAAVGLKINYFYLLAAVAIWRCPLDRDERDTLVSILMATGVVVAVYGLGQQVLGAERLVELGYAWNENVRFAGGFLRSISSFNQPFGFGFYLMVVLLIGLPQALADRLRPRNQAFLVALPLIGLALASTFVRGAWLGLAAGLAFLGAQRYRALLLVIPVAVVLLALLPADVAETALSATSSEQRLEGWQQHLEVVAANPFGTGIGSTGSAAERVLEGTGERRYQPDNHYFKTVLELGPLGLWFLVLLFLAAFLAVRDRARRLSGTDGALAWGVAASIVAAGVASMVATYLEIFPLDLLFWVLLSVVATCPTRSR